jgi:hypothetical protein
MFHWNTRSQDFSPQLYSSLQHRHRPEPSIIVLWLQTTFNDNLSVSGITRLSHLKYSRLPQVSNLEEIFINTNNVIVSITRRTHITMREQLNHASGISLIHINSIDKTTIPCVKYFVAPAVNALILRLMYIGP